MARVSTDVRAMSASKAFRRQEAASLAGLLLTGGGQVDVPPSGEAVLEVPEALAMTGEHESGHVPKPRS